MEMPSEKILLVDDEPNVLAALKRNLGKYFSIVTAIDGLSALDVISQHQDIAVILTDMKMPKMNGVELLKKVKKNAPHIRRMMLTGNSDQETAIAAVNDGSVMRFLRKPCTTQSLIDAINYALDDYRFSVESDNDEKSAVVARDSFLSMMNHEMRTPLNHILGLAQLIELPDCETAEQSKLFLETLKDSANILHIKLERILEYSRISSGAKEIQKKEFDIIQLIKSEIGKLKPSVDKRDITIAFDTLRKNYLVCGREDEIQLALRELLTNAVNFNKKQGHINVTLRSSGERTDIKISDTGRGIPDKKLVAVTTAFRQAEEGTTRSVDGLGLGLSLASLVCDRHGGALKLMSEENIGTSVILSLAQTKPQEQDHASPQRELPIAKAKDVNDALHLRAS